MISIEEFTKNLAAEFEDIEPGTIKPDTNYRDIKGWSSMYALIIIAFVDTHFDVALNADDLRSSQTIKDLYQIILAKKQS
ncbi:MAG: acyl carrier protein [Bacteroidia bacterium]